MNRKENAGRNRSGILRAAALLLAFAVLLFTGAASSRAEDAPVVKSYPELLDAVNNQKADRVLISAKYKQKGSEGTNIDLGGRTVTLVPETGDSVTITARFDVYGEGNLVLEGVNLVGPQGSFALWVGGGAHVTLGSVTGGKAKGNHGNPAVILDGGMLTADLAAGSDGTAGLGGDGVYAFGKAEATVREARGGSAAKGVGGAGVVVFDGAKATVTGEAVGGDGLYAGGKGILVGLNGEAGGEGKVTDGRMLESKKPVDPSDIVNMALLQNAIRNGETDIRLSPKFKSGGGFDINMSQFAATAETVRISGSTDVKKRTVLDFEWSLVTGSWEISEADMVSSSKKWNPCIYAIGDAQIVVNGDMTVKNAGNGCIGASGNARVTVNGKCASAGEIAYANGHAAVELNGPLESRGKEQAALGTNGSAVIHAKGDIQVNGDGNAVAARGGSVIVEGNISAKKNKSYPALYVAGGEVTVIGSVTTDSQAQTIYCKGGRVTVQGDVTSAAKKNYTVRMLDDAEEVHILGDLNAASIAARVEAGTLKVDGNLTIRSKESWALYSTDGEGQVTVDGTADRVNP